MIYLFLFSRPDLLTAETTYDQLFNGLYTILTSERLQNII
jgi:hypothetical protein